MTVSTRFLGAALWVTVVLVPGCGGAGDEAPDVGTGAALASAAGDPVQPAAAAAESTSSGAATSRRGGADPPALGKADVDGNRSRLVFERTHSDLGEIGQGRRPLAFDFVVEGPDPVLVKDVHPTCGCTNARLEVDGEPWDLTTALQPGTKASVAVVFDSTKYTFEKHSAVLIESDAAQYPGELTIRAFILPTFQTVPSPVRFGPLAVGAPPEDGVIRFQVKAREAFEILDWTVMPDGTEVRDTGVRIPDEEGDGVTWEFELVVDTNQAPGRVQGLARAETSIGLPLQIQIFGNILGPAQYLPDERLVFGLVDEGAGAERVLRIRPRGEGISLPVPVVRVNGSGWFEVERDEEAEGADFVYWVRLAAETPVGAHVASIKIAYPDAKNVPGHEIFLNARVRKAE
ncbi:MAG TPA: DUF1573 domain-containing protein [Planctomycetota bacterium]